MWFLLPPLPPLGNGYGNDYSPKATKQGKKQAGHFCRAIQVKEVSHFKLHEKSENITPKLVQEVLVFSGHS